MDEHRLVLRIADDAEKLDDLLFVRPRYTRRNLNVFEAERFDVVDVTLAPNIDDRPDAHSFQLLKSRGCRLPATIKRWRNLGEVGEARKLRRRRQWLGCGRRFRRSGAGCKNQKY